MPSYPLLSGSAWAGEAQLACPARGRGPGARAHLPPPPTSGFRGNRPPLCPEADVAMGTGQAQLSASVRPRPSVPPQLFSALLGLREKILCKVLATRGQLAARGTRLQPQLDPNGRPGVSGAPRAGGLRKLLAVGRGQALHPAGRWGARLSSPFRGWSGFTWETGRGLVLPRQSYSSRG